MSTKMTDEQYHKAEATAVKMRAEGAKWPEILTATGLSHSRAELAVMRAALTKEEKARVVALVKKDGAEQASVTLRGEGLSWGEISVRLNVPESSVRSFYKKATGNKSQGQRVGKGGRYYLREQVLYIDALRPTGTVIPADAVGREGAISCAVTQRIMKLDYPEVKNLAQDHGIKVTKRTKAQIVKDLVAVYGGTTTEKPKRVRKAS